LPREPVGADDRKGYVAASASVCANSSLEAFQLGRYDATYGQSHGANVAFRVLPGKMPPMFLMMRCTSCPQESRTHVITWRYVFSNVRVVAMS
jgi:hypothetical protein